MTRALPRPTRCRVARARLHATAAVTIGSDVLTAVAWKQIERLKDKADPVTHLRPLCIGTPRRPHPRGDRCRCWCVETSNDVEQRDLPIPTRRMVANSPAAIANDTFATRPLACRRRAGRSSTPTDFDHVLSLLLMSVGAGISTRSDAVKLRFRDRPTRTPTATDRFARRPPGRRTRTDRRPLG